VGPIVPITGIPAPQNININELSVDSSGNVVLNLFWSSVSGDGFTVTGYNIYSNYFSPVFVTSVGPGTTNYRIDLSGVGLPTEVSYGVETIATYNGNTTYSQQQFVFFNPYTLPIIFDVSINLTSNSLFFSVNDGNNVLNTLISVVPDITSVGTTQQILYSLYDIGVGSINTLSVSGNVTQYSIVPAYDLSGNTTQPLLLLASNNAGTGSSGLYVRNL